MTRRLAIVALVSLALWSPQRAGAAPEDLANEIAAKIMSPFCPGVTLENCPSDKAVALRERIETWAAQGWGEERIMAELVDLYGDPIRATPPARGWGLWAWLAPGLAVGGGAAVAVALTRRWTRRGSGVPEDDYDALVPAETRARLDEELRALRGRS